MSNCKNEVVELATKGHTQGTEGQQTSGWTRGSILQKMFLKTQLRLSSINVLIFLIESNKHDF